ncbi:MAG: hypothetical protein COA96_10055 [SAR86 cluster bacterium]|uniref:Alkyl hydroperoxide reductase subunit C/ Thiol specific antioxidant domain-containing protein n=1 Tax=SAR86 cluster bacterium TaxID=2030880 RepID=A0A2A5AY71_9GAMM|nr:MAG: hypothetical protein COA96_10055 [SAR86 cluster bacterium]
MRIAAIAASIFGLSANAIADPATVLYDNQVIEIDRTLADPLDLWIPLEELSKLNDFAVASEQICLIDFCVSTDKQSNNPLVIVRDQTDWVDVTRLASELNQLTVTDYDHGVWSFGEIPEQRKTFLESGLAPDFELTDRQGNPVRLSDFRGKKVLLLTWASW